VTPYEVPLSSRQVLLSVRIQSGYTVATITGELGGASVPALREQLRGLPDRQASRIIEIVAPGVPPVKIHDSERAVCVRPGHAVSPEHRTVR
jgi:hypothetical protein